MRAIHLVRLDKTRPALVLTREQALGALTNVTVAPVTTRVRGLSTEVVLQPRNGVDVACAVSCDNVTTVARSHLGRQVGWFYDDQEHALVRALTLAFDLGIPLAEAR